MVAAAALELVLKQGHECDKYIEAVSRGKVQRLRVVVDGCKADTQENADAVVAAIGDRCVVAELTFKNMAKLHESTLCFYHYLSVFFSPHFKVVARIPEGLILQASATAQHSRHSISGDHGSYSPSLKVSFYMGIRPFAGLMSEGFGDTNHAALVAGLGECTQLKELNLRWCYKLKSLPDSD